MATTKKNYDRYRIIDACLRSKRYWKVADIIHALYERDIIVKRRTILYDIDAMKHDENAAFFAPIKFCQHNKGYYYTDPDYSIESIPLSSSNYLALTDILHMVKHKTAFKEFGEVIDKVLKIGKYQLQDLDTKPVIEFEKAPYYIGDKHLDSLVKYSRDHQPITITYKKFAADNEEQYNLHPYFLKEYSGRWYLLALNTKKGTLQNFGLERINKIEELDITYKPCPLQHPADYYKDIIGITRPDKPAEDVILSFKPSIGQYPITKPLHHSQEIVINNKKDVRLKLHVIPNIDLVTIVLSYGNQVKVLQSDALITLMESLK